MRNAGTKSHRSCTIASSGGCTTKRRSGSPSGELRPDRTQDRLAHAVYRIRWSGDQAGTLFDHVDVLELHGTDDGWRIISLELNGLPRNTWFWIGMPDAAKRP